MYIKVYGSTAQHKMKGLKTSISSLRPVVLLFVMWHWKDSVWPYHYISIMKS